MILKNKKKTQSVLEYILVNLVFTTVGIAAFFAVVENAAFRRQGNADNYYSRETELGRVLNKEGVAQQDLRWPSKFGEYTRDADGYQGMISQEQIAQPGQNQGYTQGKNLGEYYTYKGLDWSVYRELQRNEE